MTIAGPTGCGKTQWLMDMLTHRETLIDRPIERVVWCYGEPQLAHGAFKKENPTLDVLFHRGLPENIDDLLSESGAPNVVVIDDLMTDVNTFVSDLFTKGSHHKNISVILILQHIFPPNAQSRTISLNSHYMVLFKNPRDRLSFDHLARQIAPGETAFVHDAFRQATADPYGCLCIDFKPEQEDRYRFRSHVLPRESMEGVHLYEPGCDEDCD